MARILLTDDDPVLRALGEAQLQEDGFEVLLAEDGFQALKILENTPVDLMVTDVEMPHVNGFRLLEALRSSKRERFSMLPVIMITGKDDETSIREAYTRGATSFMPKPVNWFVLSHHIEFVLRASRDALDVSAARDAAIDAARNKDALMATLRHELRSPLHVIEGFTALLTDQRNDLAPQHREYFEYISTAVRNLGERVNNLFAYADMLSGEFKISLESVEVEAPIRQAVQAVAAFAREQGVEIRVERSIGRHFLQCDGHKLGIALANIIHNAVKFSERGQTVVVSARHDEDRTFYDVRDKGVGVDPAKVDAYFSAFEQGDSGLQRTSTGVGLGLTIARTIIDAHSGLLRLSPGSDGQGAMATIELRTKLARQASAA